MEVGDLRVRWYSSRSCVWVASKNGHLEVVKVLISNDGSVNEADNDGFTPLHLASGHSEVVKLLVELEGSVNQAGYNDDITLNSISILVL